MLRVAAILALIIIKALVGQDNAQPLEMGANGLELAAVYLAGMHAVHMKHKYKENHD